MREPLLRVEVVPDQGALGAADDHLCGSWSGDSQFTWTWAIAPPCAAAASGSRRRPGRRRCGSAPCAATATGSHARRAGRSRGSTGRAARGPRTRRRRGWTSPRLIRTESTKRMSPSSPPCDQLADAAARPACSSRCGRTSGPGRAALGLVDHLRGRSASVAASGFSTSTCLPARSAARATAQVGAGRGGDGDGVDVAGRRAPRRGRRSTCDGASSRRAPAGPGRRRGRRASAAGTAAMAWKLRTRLGPQ